MPLILKTHLSHWMFCQSCLTGNRFSSTSTSYLAMQWRGNLLACLHKSLATICCGVITKHCLLQQAKTFCLGPGRKEFWYDSGIWRNVVVWKLTLSHTIPKLKRSCLTILKDKILKDIQECQEISWDVLWANIFTQLILRYCSTHYYIAPILTIYCGVVAHVISSSSPASSQTEISLIQEHKGMRYISLTKITLNKKIIINYPFWWYLWKIWKCLDYWAWGDLQGNNLFIYSQLIVLLAICTHLVILCFFFLVSFVAQIKRNGRN